MVMFMYVCNWDRNLILFVVVVVVIVWVLLRLMLMLLLLLSMMLWLMMCLVEDAMNLSKLEFANAIGIVG